MLEKADSRISETTKILNKFRVQKIIGVFRKLRTVIKPLQENIFIAGILILLLVVFFYDVAFLGKTFKVSTANSQSFPTGVYGQENNRPSYIPVNGTDSSVLEEPIYEFIKNNLKKGIVPLWNPHQAGGYPLIGMIQVGMFFPLSFILYLLPQLYAWDVFILSRIFVGGLLTYWLIRTLRMGRWPALAAAVVYMFTGPMTLLQYWVVNVEIVTPLLLLCLERLIRSPDRRNMCYVAVAVALTFFGGHPEHIFLVNVVGVLFIGFRLWSLRRRVNFKKVMPSLAGAYILGVGLSAVVLFPFLQNFFLEFWHKHAGDVGITTGEVRKRFLAIAIPHLFQKENLTYDFTFAGWWGGYLGVLPLGLAFLSLFSKQRGGLNYFFAGVAFIFWAKSYAVPVINWLGYLPLFNVCRFYIHTPHLVALMVALAAGMGVRAIVVQKDLFRKATIFSSALLLLLGGHFLFPKFFELKSAVAVQAAFFTIGVLFIWQTLLWLKDHRKISRRQIAGMVVMLLAAELFLYIHRERPRRYDTFPTVPYIEFLKNRQPRERAYGVFWAFYPNTATAYGLDDVGIFQDFLMRRYVDVINNLVYKNYFKKDLASPAVRAMALPDENPFLDLLNLRYLVFPKTNNNVTALRLVRSTGEVEDLSATLSDSTKLIYTEEVNIYERASALPRTFVVHRVIFNTQAEKTFVFLKAIHKNFRDLVLIEAPANPKIQAVLSAVPLRDDSAAEVTHFSPNEVVVSAHVQSPGFLVLSEAYHPDWQAFVDGTAVNVYAADYFLRAVFLGPGEHEVKFIFRPKWFYIGLGVSIMGLVLMVILLVRQKLMGNQGQLKG